MLQKRDELVKNVFKKDGLPGLFNLGLRFIENKTLPARVHFFPTSMQVELTTACNLRCTMCAHSHLTKNPVSMKFSEFKKLLDGAPFVELINFTGIGETLLNPEWFEIMRYAKEKGIYVWFTDNFTLMNEETAKKIIDMGVDAVAFSCDGATKKTYESIRRGAKFGKVTENVKRLVRMRNQAGKKKPELLIGFVVMKENLNEMEAMIGLAKDLGVDRVLFADVFTFEGIEEKNPSSLKRKKLESIFEKTRKKAEELGVTIMNLPSLQAQGEPECSYCWVSSYITASGEVLPCCYVPQNLGWEKQGASMGNVKEKTYAKIWKGKEYRESRERFRLKRFPLFCKDCYKIKRD